MISDINNCMRNVFDIHCTDNDLSPHIRRNLKRKHKNKRSTSKNQPHINGFSHGWSSFLLSRWIFHILFLGKMFRGGAKSTAKLEKKQHKYPHIPVKKKNKGISKILQTDVEIKILNVEMVLQKKMQKKTPSRRFETCVLFRFFFL